MVYLLQYGSEDSKLENDVLLEKIGKTLLHINDFCDMDYEFKENISKSIKRKKLVGYLWSLGHLTYAFQKDIITEFTISYTVFTEYSTGKLEKVFLEYMGLPIKKYWALSFALLNNWYTNRSDLREIQIEKFDYYKNCDSIDKKDIELMFKILGGDLETIKSINDNTLNNFDYSHNFEAIRLKPVIEILEDRYICLSLPYLVDKITTGILGDLKHRLIIQGEDYDKVLGKEVGYMFENYVWTQLDSLYNKGLANRAFNEKYNNTQVADVVIDYGEDLIFIEVKSVFIQKKYRLSQKYRNVEQGLKKFLQNKGAKQLSDRIREFKDGSISLENIDPNNVRRYWPILITCNSEIPVFDILKPEYDRILEDYNILQESDIKPLTILNLHDFEFLLESIKNGESLIEMLDEYHSDEILKNNAFYNFLADRNDKHLKYPKKIKNKYEEISKHLSGELGL